MIEFEGKKFLNEQEAYLYCLEQIKIIKQSLGNALPDPIQGPQGETGADGPRGPEGPKGNGIYGCTAALPSATAYQEGDMYLLFNGQLYKKINGNWVMQTTLKGPQGPVGLPGGSEVIANPADAATDELNKVKIDETTYNIKDFTTSQVNRLKNIVSNSFFYDDNNSRYIFDDVEVEFTYPVYFYNDLVIDSIDDIVDSSYNPLIICENFKDANGNSRFIEGNGTPLTLTGFTSSYCKWSLSGSHLMCVLAGTIANGVTLSLNTQLAAFSVPDYIKNKIVPTIYNLIEYKTIKCVSTGFGIKDLESYCDKTADGLAIYVHSAFESDEDYSFRVTIDLLIDME